MESTLLHVFNSRNHHLAGTTPEDKQTDVQYILSDVPFFAVGIFAFGACTFLLIQKRLNWITACLHGAVLSAFTGAILDLVQLIARGNHSAASVQNTNPFLALTITREIAYSLSFGLRYVSYWGFVGSPPMGGGKDACDLHSGSWGRWGITGLVLQWALVVATLAITALQVVFRVYTPVQQNSVVQDAEGALEACVSAVLILKLFLNIYLAALDSYGATRRLRLFLRYLPVMFALLISTAIGVGNILEQLFSETVLGHFMQGIELYILVLYMLVDAFRPQPTSMRRNRSSSFHNMPPVMARSSEFLLGPPKVPEPKFNPMFGNEGNPFTEPEQAKAPQPWEPSLAGYSLRVSNWFGRRPSKKSITTATEPASHHSWAHDQAERGMSPVTEAAETPLSEKVAFAANPVEPRQSPVAMAPGVATIVVSDPVDPVDVASPHALTVAVPPRVYTRTPDAELLRPVPPRARGSLQSTESPVHGLYGIVNTKRPPSAASLELDDPRDVFDRSARSSGISGLLREQAELDKSIAALRLLSRGDDSRRSSSTDAPSPNRFSLSVFPEPPWGRASTASTVLPAPVLMAVAGHRAETASPERTRQQSVPLSELGMSDADLVPPSRRNMMTASGGTQYEITSFIGHLTHPGHSLQNSISTQASISGPTDTSSKTDTALTSIPESAPPSAGSESGRPKVVTQIPSDAEAGPSKLPSPVRTLTVGGKVRPVGLPAGPRLATSTLPPSVRPVRTSSYAQTPF
ncbi:transcriptional regulator, putative [Phanerochaete sordida]|uniref:Transcriptional regulator, putative n=1 Tax=Phanerochaete sordida TaxID=48140 RepID=A0A9P3G1L2_9APHY|nr:transcriptional regulator, putative [Phanerochaete sordida]